MDTKDDFYDRRNEFEWLDNIFSKDVTESAYGIIIYAQSGVGKSTLVSKYVEYSKFNIHLISVNIPSLNNSTTTNGFYFERMYRSFLSSLYGTETLEGIKSLPTTTIDNVSVGLNAFVFGISASAKNTTEPSENPNFYRYKWLLKELDRKKYEETPIVFELENIQRMDDESYFLLQNLVQNAHNCFIIFEYTIDQYNTELKVFQLYESFRNYITLEEPYELNWLPISDVRKVMKEKAALYTDPELMAIYAQNSGNILAMKILKPPTVAQNKNYKPIRTAINNCSDQEKFLLILVSLNGGSIQISILSKIFLVLERNHKRVYWINPNNISHVLYTLTEEKFIERKEEGYYIHDSLSDQLLDYSFSEIGYLAYNLLVDYYSNKSLNEEEDFNILLNLYIKYNDERVNSLLYKLKNHLHIHQLTDKLKNKLIDMDTYLQTHALNFNLYEKIHIMLLDILFCSSDFQGVDTLLDIYENTENKIYILFRFASGAHTMAKDYFQEEYKKEIYKYGDNSRMSLFLKLCYLNNLMQDSGDQEPIAFANDILKNENYVQYPEYYFVLKTITFYQPNSEAITNLNICSDMFYNMGRNDLGIMTDITLCTRMAQDGKTTWAKNKLLILQKENFQHALCNNYMFLNNLSAVELLEGIATDETIFRLEDAILYPTSEYEHALILNNMLIAYLMSKEYKKADDIADRLSLPQYDQIHGEQFCHIRWTNLLFYSRIRNKQKISYYEGKLIHLANRCEQDDLRQYITLRLSSAKCIPSENRHHYLYRNLYRSTFIGYWQPEIDYTIAHENGY